MTDFVRKTALFLYALAAGLLLGAVTPVYNLWTGGWGNGLYVIGALIAAFALAWSAERLRLRRAASWVALLGALCVGFAFLNTEALSHGWEILSMKVFAANGGPADGLTWELWRGAARFCGLFWFVPAAFALMFLWRGDTGPKGRFTVFVGGCVGLILARILSGRVPTVNLIDASATGMLLTAPLLIAVAYRRLWVRIPAVVAAVLLIAAWWTLRVPAEAEPLDHPYFASVATRDLNYLTLERTYRDGRVVRCAGIETAPQTAAQMIPLLLRPFDNARLAYRLAAGEPIAAGADTELKGLYDAIYVELPPAWVGDERDYFGTAAFAALEEHLQEDGIVVYALDARALDSRMLLERMAVMRTRFPYLQLWMTDPDLWILAASRKPIRSEVSAISDLMDRDDVRAALYAANIDSPVKLLSSCLTDDMAAIEADLEEPIEASIPWRTSDRARELLFDGFGGGRLIRDFEPFRDYDMKWLDVPEGLEEAMRPVLAALQGARHQALSGKLAEAAAGNGSDPYLLGLAERDIATARALVVLAKYREAIGLFYNAFAIAAPRMADILEAARVATKGGEKEAAAEFYRLAGSLAPEDPAYLTQYMYWLAENKDYAGSLRAAETIVRVTGDADVKLASAALLQSAKMMAKLGRVSEAVALAYELANAAVGTEEEAHYVTAYGDVLIDSGNPVLGVRVKDVYERTRTLCRDGAPTEAAK